MFKKLKSIFIVDDEEFVKKVTDNKDAYNNGTIRRINIGSKEPASVSGLPPSSKAGEGQVTEKFMNILLGVFGEEQYGRI